ncbi:MAG: glycosyltransferase family 2 protein [Planctomycetota bacterium]
MMRVDVVYVNYNSTAWLARSIASLLAAPPQGFALGAVVVVDNASSPADQALLDGLPDAVRVVRAGANRGFAAGCNLGARAGDAPALLFLNPDTRVLADTLPPMVPTWHARAGRVLLGPRHFMDDACTLGFAPLHGTAWHTGVSNALWGRGFAPDPSLRALRARVALWRAERPTPVRALSGGALLVGRAAYEELGGFDERYFLYVEDTDLCLRARKRGIDVLYEPRARIVHYGDQSSRQDAGAADGAAAASERVYLRKFHGVVSRGVRRLVLSLATRLPARQRRWGAGSATTVAHVFERPGRGPWVVELARSPMFDHGVTVFPDGDTFGLPADLWPRLRPGRYFARIAEEDDVGAWHERALFVVDNPGGGKPGAAE